MTIAEQIEAHKTWLDYHLEAWESATNRGSYESAERALQAAANHAAILTALRQQPEKEE